MEGGSIVKPAGALILRGEGGAGGETNCLL